MLPVSSQNLLSESQVVNLHPDPPLGKAPIIISELDSSDNEISVRADVFDSEEIPAEQDLIENLSTEPSITLSSKNIMLTPKAANLNRIIQVKEADVLETLSLQKKDTNSSQYRIYRSRVESSALLKLVSASNSDPDMNVGVDKENMSFITEQLAKLDSPKTRKNSTTFQRNVMKNWDVYDYKDTPSDTSPGDWQPFKTVTHQNKIYSCSEDGTLKTESASSLVNELAGGQTYSDEDLSCSRMSRTNSDVAGIKLDKDDSEGAKETDYDDDDSIFAKDSDSEDDEDSDSENEKKTKKKFTKTVEVRVYSEYLGETSFLTAELMNKEGKILKSNVIEYIDYEMTNEFKIDCTLRYRGPRVNHIIVVAYGYCINKAHKMSYKFEIRNLFTDQAHMLIFHTKSQKFDH